MQTVNSRVTIHDDSPIAYIESIILTYIQSFIIVDYFQHEQLHQLIETMVKTTLTAFSHICEDAPGFAVDGEKVTVITEPSKFYEELCTRSKVKASF